MSHAEARREAAPPPLGPVQMLVLGFTEDSFKGAILPELRRLRDLDVVRLLDLLVVRKDEHGEIEAHQVSDLDEDEARCFGKLIGALVGFGNGGEETEDAAFAGAAELEGGHVFDQEAVWYVSDVIPAGTAAAIALIEHRWAIPLRDRIVEAGGFALADEWIHPADLIAVGEALCASSAGSVHA
jgi:uncharacterized membrane protein